MQTLSAARSGSVNITAVLFAAFAALLAVPLLGPRLAALCSDLAASGIGSETANSDFINYWMAPNLTLIGKTEVLSHPVAYMVLLREMFGPAYPDHAWSYPPHAILILLPLAAFPYEAAMVAFLVATLALYLWAAEAFLRRHAPDADRALFWSAHLPFLLFNAAATQNGFLTGALLLGFLAVSGRRHFLAGLLLAILTTKPQLGLLVPLFLVCRRQWLEILWAAALTMVLVGISIQLFGLASWRDFVLLTLPQQDQVMRSWSGGMLLMMPSVVAGLRLMGIDSAHAVLLQAAFSLACLPLVALAIWRATSELNRILALVLGTALILPYSFAYDMGALVSVAAAMLASGGFGPRSAWLAMICFMPLAVVAFAFAGIPVAPLVLLAALVCLCMPGRTGRETATPSG